MTGAAGAGHGTGAAAAVGVAGEVDADARIDGAFDVLRGVTVVEFGDDLAGSIAAHRLAVLGATVWLLEPARGCALRRLEAAPLLACYGRGKRSVSLEAALAAPAAWAGVDLVIEPGDGPGQGPAAIAGLRAGEPDGPLSLSFREDDGSRLGELGAQAAFGFSAFLGRPQDPPHRAGFALVTHSAAVLGVQAVLAALPAKQDHGLGQRLRVPMSRVAANLLNNVITASVEPDQETGFSRGWASAPYLGVPAADGDVEILFYGPDADRGWRDFCGRLGAPRVAADARFATYGGRTQHAGALRDALAPHTAGVARDVLLAMLWDCGAMAVPRWGVDEAVASEQARANGLAAPRASPADPWLLVSPWALDGRRACPGGPPALGADTGAFLARGGVA